MTKISGRNKPWMPWWYVQSVMAGEYQHVLSLDGCYSGMGEIAQVIV